MSFTRRLLLLVLVNVLLPIACLVFASGFFPYKPFLPGFAKFDPDIHDEVPAAPFNRVIFMVVDALRSDFVFSATSGFTFTQRLISQGSAWPFTAHAAAPTVTMPRVKAITTGSIPSFVDMILNVAESDTTSTLAYQDTWLIQMKSKDGGKLVMYGDDTWLKLFPDTFARADGTVSFFVSDFTEVDNNVTRHIPEELRNDDWNAMIMHYLGMDHIGHKAGPRSVNMKPKQKEMDDIVRQIYNALESEEHLSSTLLVLCGDHGMNEAGNHGGSAPGETSPALVFVSPQLQNIQSNYSCPTEPKKDFDYYDKVEQSDIAPTLAGLLGFPVPMNNLGVFISQFLSFWKNDVDKVRILYGNAVQMLRIVKATFPHPWYEDETFDLDCRTPQSSKDVLACSWKRARDLYKGPDPNSGAVLQALTNFCQQSQDKLSSTASNYNLSRLYLGIVLSALAVVISLTSYGWPRRSSVSVGTLWSFIAALAYTLMMFASSYVEEEQQFWYWISSAWLTILVLSGETSKRALPLTFCLAMLRILRRWNQSGQKYAGAEDVVAYLREHASWSLWPLLVVTFVDIGLEIGTAILTPMVAMPMAMVLVAACLAFKLAFTLHEEPELLKEFPVPEAVNSFLHDGLARVNITNVARELFIGCGAASLVTLFRGNAGAAGPGTTKSTSGDRSPDKVKNYQNIYTLLQTNLPIFTLVLIMQTRITNIPLFLFFNAIRRLLNRLALSSRSIALTTLFFAQCSYFLMGGTNAISSIDLSNAYNGVTSYNPIPVGILLFIGNWAGPLFWTLSGILAALQLDINILQKAGGQQMGKQAGKPEAFSPALLVFFESISFFMAIAVCSVMLACTALRTHLFVWTVFSPKFLYVAAWLGGWHLVVGACLGLGLLLSSVSIL